MSTFVHMELNTTDPEAAKAFYENLFGWSFDGMPMPAGDTYWFATGQTAPGIAMQKKPMAEGPTSWLGYISVDSVRATVQKARDLGAQVVVEYQQVGDMGALAVLIDPTGAPVAVWEPSAGSRAQQESKALEEAEARDREQKTAIERAVSAATSSLERALEAARSALESARRRGARKTTAKKKTAKKAPKKTAKKKATKKAAKKKATKAAKKKATKKAGRKKVAKKGKKRATKKTAKRAAKKKTAKRPAKKKTAKKKAGRAKKKARR